MAPLTERVSERPMGNRKEPWLEPAKGYPKARPRGHRRAAAKAYPRADQKVRMLGIAWVLPLEREKETVTDSQ